MKIGKIFGISIEIHPTFLLLLGLVLFSLIVLDSTKILPTLILIFILFGTVFVHELFHSAVAIIKGFEIKKIVLLPIGGISMVEDIPENPKDEFLIAIAGPAFNFLVVLAILIITSILPNLPWPYYIFKNLNLQTIDEAITKYPLFALFWVNLLLGSFNLFLPALPMDGGRVFRSLLALKLGFLEATKIAATISKFIAIGMLIFGFMIQDIIIMIIGLFVLFGAEQEKEIATLKDFFKKIDLEEAIKKKVPIIKKNISIDELVAFMKEKRETFAIIKLNENYFVISAEDLETIEKKERNSLVEKFCRKIENIDIKDKDRIIKELIIKKSPVVLVSKNGKKLGFILETEINKMYVLSKLD